MPEDQFFFLMKSAFDKIKFKLLHQIRLNKQKRVKGFPGYSTVQVAGHPAYPYSLEFNQCEPRTNSGSVISTQQHLTFKS